MAEKTGPALLEIYAILMRAYGPQHWWPAETPTEVVIGAILTQNTAWTNVERAIDQLRRADALSFSVLRDMPVLKLEQLIKPSGTYRVKALRLKAFADVLWKDHGGSLQNMFAGSVEHARARLLAIHGIGPETADAILLYAAGKASFVVDAYTVRILRRHFLLDDTAKYDDVQGMFHRDLPPDPRMFNEYHALLVAIGKRHCRATAQCDGCPLESLPHLPQE